MTSGGKRYVAVIADLVRSRRLPDRASVQERLEATLAELNDEFSSQIASDFIVTLGDEFQGLLEIECPFETVWWAYQRRMRTVVTTRFSFGIGTLETGLKPTALGMDGPCFHAARAGLDEAKKHDRSLMVRIAEPTVFDALVDRGTLLLERVMQSWSPRQAETVDLLAELGQQEKVAERREVTKQTVHDSLTASHGLAWLDMFASLSQSVRSFDPMPATANVRPQGLISP
ncbi:MAG: SatD family protein [Acidobacteriota bacterium]